MSASFPSRMRTTWLAAAVLVVSLSAAVTLVHAMNRATAATQDDDALYVSSGKTLKRMSLGYDGLLADLYWTRAVQYFGRQHSADERGYRLLSPLLRITSDLDPHLLPTYEYGSVFLAQRPPNGAGDPHAAVELVRRGIADNPDQWRLYCTLGFIYSTELKDYPAAAEAFRQGSQVPGAHAWLAIMAANMARHGGELQTSLYLWSAIARTTRDEKIADNALKHLRALEAEQDIQQLESLVRDYRAENGHAPATWNELVAAGWLLRVPHDPSGRVYRLSTSGTVSLQDSEAIPFFRE
jgi:hypothetical protein